MEEYGDVSVLFETPLYFLKEDAAFFTENFPFEEVEAPIDSQISTTPQTKNTTSEDDSTVRLWVLLYPKNEPEGISFEFLNKILAAIGISSENYRFFEDFSDFQQIYETSETPKVPILVFGVPPERFGLVTEDIYYYYLQILKNQLYLFADSLHSISLDVEKKKSLWLALQKLQLHFNA